MIEFIDSEYTYLDHDGQFMVMEYSQVIVSGQKVGVLESQIPQPEKSNEFDFRYFDILGIEHTDFKRLPAFHGTRDLKYGEKSQRMTREEAQSRLRTYLSMNEPYLSSSRKVVVRVDHGSGRTSWLKKDKDLLFFSHTPEVITFADVPKNLLELQHLMGDRYYWDLIVGFEVIEVQRHPNDAVNPASEKLIEIRTEADAEGWGTKRLGLFKGTAEQALVHCVKNKIRPYYSYSVSELDVIDVQCVSTQGYDIEIKSEGRQVTITELLSPNAALMVEAEELIKKLAQNESHKALAQAFELQIKMKPVSEQAMKALIESIKILTKEG